MLSAGLHKIRALLYMHADHTFRQLMSIPCVVVSCAM